MRTQTISRRSLPKLAPPTPGQSPQLFEAIQSAALQAVLEQELSLRQRQILYLRYDKGMTMAQIAKTLGITISCVSHTHRRAKAHLMEKLRQYRTLAKQFADL